MPNFSDDFNRADALDRNNWNIRATAALIGTHRTNLYKIMSSLGIKRPGKARHVGRLMTPEFRRFLGMRAPP